MKIFNFSVTENIGRTFEIPFDKVIDFLKIECPANEDIGKLSDTKIANYLYYYCSDLIEKYEINNNSYESKITDIKRFSESDA